MTFQFIHRYSIRESMSLSKEESKALEKIEERQNWNVLLFY
jgi:hypothetical protein